MLARAKHHHSFAFHRYQSLIFQDLQYPAHHFPRTTDNTADLLAGNLDLHAIGVGHGFGQFAQVEQSSGHPASDIKEGQVAHFLGGLAQSFGHLGANGIENIGAFAATLLCGYLGETYGWAWGFGAAGIGMLLGLVTFVLGQPWLHGHAEPADPDRLAARSPLGISVEWTIYLGGLAGVAVA